VKSLIIGLTVAVIVLAGLVGFLIYASQENISQTVTELTNPCLVWWSEISEIADPSFSRLPESKHEVATKFFESGCRQNLDWLPDDHPNKERLTAMWGKR